MKRKLAIVMVAIAIISTLSGCGEAIEIPAANQEDTTEVTVTP